VSSEPNNQTANSVQSARNSTVVQTESVQSLTVWGRDRRTLWLLVVVLVAVLAIGGVIAWLVREPELAGEPPVAVASADLNCASAGWVAPDPGKPSIPYVNSRPPEAILGSGGVITATVQGRNDMAVVLQSMRAEVLSRKPAAPGVLLPPLCAGEVTPRFFTVDLSAATPAAVPAAAEHNGRRLEPKNFPFKVDPNDVEQLAIRVDSPAEDVEWVLWVRWSSGGSSGELRIDDQGKPFRTTATRAAAKWCVDERTQPYQWRPSCG
jgi:hypothetical protein